MALLGKAALAMWWDMAADMRREFEDWHSHEHFPERLGVPGFLRSSRWAAVDGAEGFFVMYELTDHDVLASAAYLERLNAPTPWSTRLMPHHRGMVRSQSHVLHTRGALTAGHVMTLRLSPMPGRADELRAMLSSLIDTLASRPGFTGGHLLAHQAPDIEETTEQKIRGSADRVADWTLLICGYDKSMLETLAAEDTSAASLMRFGASDTYLCGIYSLSYAAMPADLL